MNKRKNTRINTLFSEIAFDWLKSEAEENKHSLAQVVRGKIEQVRKGEELLKRLTHLEKVIKKSHSVIVEKLGGVK